MKAVSTLGRGPRVYSQWLLALQPILVDLRGSTGL